MSDRPSFYDAVYDLVREIPRGRVSTYGRIASALGSPRASRAVGYALFNLPPGSDVPWQRVINAQGLISSRGQIDRAELQQRLLEREGIAFDADGRVDLKRFAWIGPELLVRWDGDEGADKLDP